MKLTWFGGTTLRIHIGGEILVMNAPADAGEIVSGADRVFSSAETLPQANGWRPRSSGRLIDAEPQGVLLHRLGNAVLVDAAGEPPLLIGHATPGRWGDGAVMVLFEAADPPPVRLIALALDDVDAAIEHMAPKLRGTALVALERAMALEV
jgi:hypothetical protein